MLYYIIWSGFCAALVLRDAVTPDLPVVDLGYVGGNETSNIKLMQCKLAWQHRSCIRQFHSMYVSSLRHIYIC